MKYIKIEHVNNDQIMLIQNELNDLYYVVLERQDNYSFSPDYVSKPYKSRLGAVKAFNKYIAEHKVNHYE